VESVRVNVLRFVEEEPTMRSNRWLAASHVMCAVMASLLLSGCMTWQGKFERGTTGIHVSLSTANYKLVKANARGQSTGFSLLGVIPVVQPSYVEAKEQLYNSVGESLIGRSIALINQTEDTTDFYLVLFSIPRVTISADIIEFTDHGAPKPPDPKTD
jgi:hypothetical protein